MFDQIPLSKNREKNYETLQGAFNGLIDTQENRITNLANASALIYYFMDTINWAGFYLTDEKETLVLGPFQGLPACTKIPFNQGVCGRAAALQKTVIVDDVNAFDDHIACDARSQSEIVVPLIKNGETVGVIDLDSPEKNRFTKLDQTMLETLAKTLVDKCW